MVITELPPDNAKTALEALCLPVVTPLQVGFISSGVIHLNLLCGWYNPFCNVNNQEAVSQGPEVLNKKHARELTVHIDRFAYIFRCDPNPLVICFISLYLFICHQHYSETNYRYVNHPEAVADAIQRLWPIFKAIFDL